MGELLFEHIIYSMIELDYNVLHHSTAHLYLPVDMYGSPGVPTSLSPDLLFLLLAVTRTAPSIESSLDSCVKVRVCVCVLPCFAAFLHVQ